MTELIFDLDGRAITISIIAPDEADDATDASWLLHARWDEHDGSRAGTAVIHAGASLEDFSHQGLARLVRAIMRALQSSGSAGTASVPARGTPDHG